MDAKKDESAATAHVLQAATVGYTQEGNCATFSGEVHKNSRVAPVNSDSGRERKAGLA